MIKVKQALEIKELRKIEYSVMFSAKEMANLNKLADASKINKSVYLRALIENRLPANIPSININVLSSLGKAFSNLNQISRNLNEKNHETLRDIENILIALRTQLLEGLQND
ncbi:MAG: hypothetical protein ABL920_09880 [Methylotenera sp.]